MSLNLPITKCMSAVEKLVRSKDYKTSQRVKLRLDSIIRYARQFLHKGFIFRRHTGKGRFFFLQRIHIKIQPSALYMLRM